MAKKWASTLSDAQFKLARAFESAGLCSISQAVKAFERHNDAQIAEWKAQLSAIYAKRDRDAERNQTKTDAR